MRKACNNFRNKEKINIRRRDFFEYDPIILFLFLIIYLYAFLSNSRKNLETESRRNFNTNSIVAIKLISR